MSAQNPPKRTCRNGVSVVELVFVMPLLLVLTFGVLEICEGIFLKQKMVIGAHEGARVAIRRDATTSSIRNAVATYFDARGLKYSIVDDVTVTPAPEQTAVLEPITVRVTLDVDSNMRMPLSMYQYLKGDEITVAVTMLKEYASN